MKAQLVFLMVTIALVSPWRMRRADVPVSPEDEEFLNLDPEKERVCKTKNNQTGICVNERECNEDHTIVPGGIIENTDLRAGDCVGTYDWCCTQDMTTKRPRVTKAPLTVVPTPVPENACVLEDRTGGTCVLAKYCQPNNTESGGVIGNKDLRSKNCPPSQICCKIDDVTTEGLILKVTNPDSGSKLVTNPKPDEGTPTPTDPKPTSASPVDPEKNRDNLKNCQNEKCICPTCAAIFRIGGHPLTMSDTGLYCAGTIIRPRVVLTSAGCISAGRKKVVWIQVPGSTDPQRKYNVTEMAKRTGYNSGTKEYDIGLMLLAEDVRFGANSGDRLELGPVPTLQGNCSSAGFNLDDDKFTVTKLAITSGSCTSRGNGIDVACGRTTDDCILNAGSPIICPSGKNGALAVTGVAKDRCDEGKVMLTNLEPSVNWVRGHKWLTDNNV